MTPTLAEPPELTALFGALAEPNRRRVLRLVARREHTVGELVTTLDLRQSAVSQHLKVLRDAGLVEARAEGNRRIYQADPAGLAALRAQLDMFWNQALATFEEVVDHDNTKEE